MVISFNIPRRCGNTINCSAEGLETWEVKGIDKVTHQVVRGGQGEVWCGADHVSQSSYRKQEFARPVL